MANAEKTLAERDDYSHGFDRGNYGNAYESQEWESWSEANCFNERSVAYQAGMLLGFFSSYELDEISDEEIRANVEFWRSIHGDE